MVVHQRTEQEVGQRCDSIQEPRETQTQTSVATCVVTLVVHRVADVAVAIDGDGCDVEDTADNTKAQNEATQLALHCVKRPAAVEDGQQGQGVWVKRHHQVSYRKAHHKYIT